MKKNLFILIAGLALALATTNSPAQPTGRPPSIGLRPADHDLLVGDSLNLFVGVSGATPMSYQWRKDTVPLPGETNATFTIASVQLADAGYYSCAVTNAYGGVISGPGLVTVTVPAAEILVENLNDSGPGSLRQAIIDANASAGTNRISFQSGLSGTINLESGLPLVSNPLRLAGPGASRLAIRRNGTGTYGALGTIRHLWVSGLTFQNFNGDGGALNNASYFGYGLAFSVADCVFDGNASDGTGGVSVGTAVGQASIINCLFTNNSGGSGAALYLGNPEEFTIADCRFVNNAASEDGGALFITPYGSNSPPSPVLRGTISRCAFEGNQARDGGAIFFNWGRDASISGPPAPIMGLYEVFMRECALSSNSATGSGGAICNIGWTWLYLDNCTISGNTAGNHGGGLYVSGHSVDPDNYTSDTTLINCTVTANRCAMAGEIYGEGGGIMVLGSGARCLLWNTIVAGNAGHGLSSDSPDVYGAFTSYGYNLIGKSDHGTGFTIVDILGSIGSPVDPKLSPLGNYGGPTLSHMLILDSPAIDRGGRDHPYSSPVNTHTLFLSLTDQRGQPRVVDDPSRTNSLDGCDMGATERISAPGTPPIFLLQPNRQTVKADFMAALVVDVLGSEPLAYQWRFNGSILPGATSKDLVLTNLLPVNAGNYDLVVTNAYGSATSQVAVLTVAYFQVSNLNDSGPGSLRQAVIDANAAYGPDSIYFQPGLTGTIHLETALPDLAGALHVVGPGASQLTVRRNGAATFGAFYAPYAGTIDSFCFNGLTFQNFNRNEGAIFVRYATVTVADCVFDGNASSSISGVFAQENESVTISDCAFTNNSGTALTLAGPKTFSVVDCVFVNNSVPGNAAGLYAASSPYYYVVGTVRRCTFTGNYAGSSGGAMGFGADRPYGVEVSECTLAGNTSAYDGGAIANGCTSLRLVNCTISGNTAGASGGGFINSGGNWAANLTLVNCTVTANRCDTRNVSGAAGGIYSGVYAGSMVTLRNTIVAGNTDAGANEYYPDVRGAFVSQGWNLIGMTNGGTGFTNSTDLLGSMATPLNPRLAPLANYGGLTLTHLPLMGSPALDRGNVAGLNLVTDQRGQSRVVDDAEYPNAADGSDIGAVERFIAPGTPPFFVQHPPNQTAKATSNTVMVAAAVGSEPLTFQWRHEGISVPGATNQELALVNLQPADAGNYDLMVANAFGSVTSQVAVLTVAYFQVSNLNDSGPGSLRQAVTDANAATGPDSIYFQPGLTGTINLETALPNITESLRVIGPGASLLTVRRNGAGTYGAFYGPQSDTDILLVSGLTFQNFNRDEGAIFVRYVTLTVADCVFDGNASGGTGGVMAGECKQATLTHCVFSDNHGGNGGGLRLAGGQTFTVADCRFVNNSAVGNGGALDLSPNYYTYTVGTVRRCTFTGNSASSAGGAIVCAADRPYGVEVSECTLAGNTSAYDGGAIANGCTSLRLVNCTISGNTAGASGGGFINSGGNWAANLTLVNCTVTANRCDTRNVSGSAGGIYSGVYAGSMVTLRNTIVAGNTDAGANEYYPDVRGAFVSQGWNLIGMTNGGTGFTNSTDLLGSIAAPLDPQVGPLSDYGGPTLTHGLLPGSPALDQGNVADLNLATDQRGLPRVVDEAGVANAAGGDDSDIGAFEGVLSTEAPVMVGQPQNQVVVRQDVSAESPVSFIVSASNATGYAWYFIRSGVTNLIAGATTPTLAIPNARREDSGQYFAVAANPFASATSSVATLQVIVPQRFVAAEMPTDGRICFSFRDQDGGLANDLSRLTVLSTSDFAGPNTVWQTNAVTLTITNGMIQFSDPQTPLPARRFYRILEH